MNVTPIEENLVQQKILISAETHFLAHGFRGVTMSDLAAELGMSKKTLYAHFSTKNELLERVVEQKMARIDADLGNAVEGDFFVKTNHLLGCLRSHWEGLKPPFIRDLVRETPELFHKMQAHRRAMIERHFGKLLQEGRDSGVIRQDIPVALMIEILIGTADSLLKPDKLLSLGLPPKTCLSAIVTIFFEGTISDRERRNL